MEKLKFELTNKERKYLGLIPVEKNWELIKLNDHIYFYFEGEIIRKEISIGENSYHEQELNEKTAENRMIVLPKTSRGKPKKLNFTATQSFSPFGVYFSFAKDYVVIANYTTQTTYYGESFKKEKKLKDLKAWLDQWISETTKEDLKEIEAFKRAKRQHCKFKEGDFFAFKIGRRQWGFGRILIDVAKRRKELKENKNYGLTSLMMRPLIVKVYHKISDNLEINLEKLSQTMALPSQAVADNHFYYGEKIIIGHKPLEIDEYDMLISYNQSMNWKEWQEKGVIYLQYGFIYKESNRSKFDKYLSVKDKKAHLGYFNTPYRNERVGYGLNIDKLKECIAQKSNQPHWESGRYDAKYDLRNPANLKIKREIFKAFGLNADKSYAENLKIT